MKWQFTINDVVVDPPVGWDATKVTITRDMLAHGILFDYTGNDYEYHGVAARMIKAEYDLNGVDGAMTLTIEYDCAGYWQHLFTGSLSFKDYVEYGGSLCYCTIPVENSDDIMTMMNRRDQEVDLLANTTFDQSSLAPNYAKLGFDVILPPKTIILTDSAEVETSTDLDINLGSVPLIQYDTAPSAPNRAIFNLLPQFDKTNFTEFGFFNPQFQPYNLFLCSGFLAGNPVTPVNCATGFQLLPGTDVSGKYYVWIDPIGLPALIVNDVDSPNFQYIDDFDLSIDTGTTFSLNNTRISALYFVVAIQRADGSMDYLDVHEYLNSTDPGDEWLYHTDHSVTYTNSFTNISLAAGEYLFATYCGIMGAYLNTNATAGADGMTITASTGSVIATAASQKAATPAKCFMINEAISRAVECITDNRILAYSEFFGRTDSQPYAVDADGCGSLEVITNGLFIRQKGVQMNISLKEIFEGIEPIHHIGWGTEPDPARPGFNRLRVEHWAYFYSNEIVLTCNNIFNIKYSVIETDHYSTFRFGYSKWESQEYSGLDEFLTKRGYRTTLTQVQNELTKISTMIAGGYAIEITRRHDADTTDWQYDNDNFIICVMRDGDDIVVEQGGITSPENIIDPASVYNFRISPIRNAMRWTDKLFSSYKVYSNDNKLIFIDGEGNYFAKGLMTDTTCRIESVAVAENDEIVKDIFAHPPYPLLAPARVEFDYPFSVDDLEKIISSPYGMIEYDGKLGWIDTITPDINTGLASFKLIPEYEIL